MWKLNIISGLNGTFSDTITKPLTIKNLRLVTSKAPFLAQFPFEVMRRLRDDSQTVRKHAENVNDEKHCFIMDDNVSRATFLKVIKAKEMSKWAAGGEQEALNICKYAEMELNDKIKLNGEICCWKED